MNSVFRMCVLFLTLPSLTVVHAREWESFPEAMVVVNVVDEDGVPVAGAITQVHFEGPQPVVKSGITNENGVFEARGRTSGVAFCTARKTGFYDSLSVRVNFERDEPNGPWQPPSSFRELVLKRIIDPVPMYARKVLLVVPVLDAPVAFDFEVGDWVPPFGKGRVADLIFNVSRRWKGMDDFYSSVQISFSNKWDGIQAFDGDSMSGSQLTSPHRAPLSGYQNAWSRVTSVSPTEGRKNWGSVKNRNYIFRVRTKEDDRGTLEEANYGKIYGDIVYGGEASEKMEIIFSYYFNPAVNSRSLEFDPMKNLAGQRINKP